MSFLSNILGSIGSAATSVGQGFSSLLSNVPKATGARADWNQGPVDTTSVTAYPTSTYGGGWGAFTKEVAPALLKNVKFGDVPIQTPKGPSVSMLKSGKYKGGPALPTSKGAELSIKDIRKFGEAWVKSQEQRALADAYTKEYYSNIAKSPRYLSDAEYIRTEKKPTWREVIEQLYENQ